MTDAEDHDDMDAEDNRICTHCIGDAVSQRKSSEDRRERKMKFRLLSCVS
jgi:hypothetical protein